MEYIIREIRKKKYYILFLITIILFLIQTFASKIGGVVADCFDYTMIDKNDVFMHISVHHIVQMIIALITIVIIGKIKKINFNLKPKVDKVGIHYTSVFTIVILIYIVITYIIGYKLNTIEPYGYKLDTKNVIGSLGFQLLLSGTSEEILFRALPITVFYAFLCNKEKKNFKFPIIISAILFSIAHIKWSISPFVVSFSCFQLIYAFVLGLIYGVTYIKSKSIVYPMLMHSFSNFLMVGIGYIFEILKKC